MMSKRWRKTRSAIPHKGVLVKAMLGKKVYDAELKQKRGVGLVWDYKNCDKSCSVKPDFWKIK